VIPRLTVLRNGADAIIAKARLFPELHGAALRIEHATRDQRSSPRFQIHGQIQVDLHFLCAGLQGRGEFTTRDESALGIGPALWQTSDAEKIPQGNSTEDILAFRHNPNWLKRYPQEQRDVYGEIVETYDSLVDHFQSPRQEIVDLLLKFARDIANLYRHPDFSLSVNLLSRLKAIANNVGIDDGYQLQFIEDEVLDETVVGLRKIHKRLDWGLLEAELETVLQEKYRGRVLMMSANMGLPDVRSKEDLFKEIQTVVKAQGWRGLRRVIHLLDLDEAHWRQVFFRAITERVGKPKDTAIDFLKIGLDFYLQKEGIELADAMFDIRRGFGIERFAPPRVGKGAMAKIAAGLYYYFLGNGEQEWAAEVARQMDSAFDHRFEWDRSYQGFQNMGLDGFERWGHEKLRLAKRTGDTVVLLFRHVLNKEGYSSFKEPRLMTESELQEFKGENIYHQVPMHWNGEYWQIHQTDKMSTAYGVPFLEAAGIAYREAEHRMTDMRHANDFVGLSEEAGGRWSQIFVEIAKSRAGADYDPQKEYTYYLYIPNSRIDGSFNSKPQVLEHFYRPRTISTCIPIHVIGESVRMGDEIRGVGNQLIAKAIEGEGLAKRSDEQRLKSLGDLDDLEGLPEESDGIWKDIFVRLAEKIVGRPLKEGDRFYFSVPRSLAYRTGGQTWSTRFALEPKDQQNNLNVEMVWNDDRFVAGNISGEDSLTVLHALENAGYVDRSFDYRLQEIGKFADVNTLFSEQSGKWADFIYEMAHVKLKGRPLRKGDCFTLVSGYKMYAVDESISGLIGYGPDDNVPDKYNAKNFAKASLTWMGTSWYVQVECKRLGWRLRLTKTIRDALWIHVDGLADEFDQWVKEYFRMKRERPHPEIFLIRTGLGKYERLMMVPSFAGMIEVGFGSIDLCTYACALYQSFVEGGRSDLAAQVGTFMDELTGHRLHWNNSLDGIEQLSVQDFEALNPEAVLEAKHTGNILYFNGTFPARRDGVIPGQFEGGVTLGAVVDADRLDKRYFKVGMRWIDGSWVIISRKGRRVDDVVKILLLGEIARRSMRSETNDSHLPVALRSLKGAPAFHINQNGHARDLWISVVEQKRLGMAVERDLLNNELGLSGRDWSRIDDRRFSWNDPTVITLAETFRVFNTAVLQMILEKNGGLDSKFIEETGIEESVFHMPGYYFRKTAHEEMLARDVEKRKKLLIALYQNRGQTTRGQIARRFGFDRKTSMDRFLLQTGGDEKAVLGIPIEQLCYLNSLGDTVSIALWLNMARGMQKVGREITSRGLLDWFNKEYRKWLKDWYDITMPHNDWEELLDKREYPLYNLRNQLYDDMLVVNTPLT
jgi:hypothetical protein